MLLTDDLIETLHGFRLGVMKGFVSNQPTQFDGMQIGGGYARFAGDRNPLTQAYGLGHWGAPVDWRQLDEFYRERAHNYEIILTPFASASTLREASEIGFVPHHFESVMAQTAPTVTLDSTPGIEIEEVKGDLTTWMQISDAGWGESGELAAEPSPIAKMFAEDPAARHYMARYRGEPAAAASMIEFEGKFLFAGGSTRLQFRGKGLQNALTQRRLYDAGAGSLVKIVTEPGSQSHRNAQRLGFQPLYSKLVLFRR